MERKNNHPRIGLEEEETPTNMGQKISEGEPKGDGAHVIDLKKSLTARGKKKTQAFFNPCMLVPEGKKNARERASDEGCRRKKEILDRGALGLGGMT